MENNICMPTCKNECVDNNSFFVSGICDPCKIDLTTNKFWSEFNFVGNISVPCEKPDMEGINSINTTVSIIKKKVIETPDSLGTANLEGRKVTGRKLIVEGLVCVTVGYTSTNKDQSAHTFHATVPFSTYIVIPKNPFPNSSRDALTVNFDVLSCVEDVFVKDSCNRDATLLITMLLQAVPKPLSNCIDNDPCECDSNQIVIKGVCPVQKVRNLLTDRSKYWVELSVPEILNVPSYKPSVEQILSVVAQLKILNQKVIQTPTSLGPNREGLFVTGKKLIIEALISQKVMYVSNKEDQSVHTVHFDIPFSAFIVVPNETKCSDKFVIYPCIEDIFICSLNQRQIFKNVTVFIKAAPLICPLP